MDENEEEISSREIFENLDENELESETVNDEEEKTEIKEDKEDENE